MLRRSIFASRSVTAGWAAEGLEVEAGGDVGEYGLTLGVAVDRCFKFALGTAESPASFDRSFCSRKCGDCKVHFLDFQVI